MSKSIKPTVVESVADSDVNDQLTAHLIAVWNSRSVTIEGMKTLNQDNLAFLIDNLVREYKARGYEMPQSE